MTGISSFNLETTAENEDVTAYGDDSRTRAQTFKDWNCEFAGNLDRSDAQQASLLSQLEDGTLSAQDLRMYTATSAYWYGSAILSGWSVNSDVGSKVNISFSFLSSGTLYYEDGT
jgi:hypothetical protein